MRELYVVPKRAPQKEMKVRVPKGAGLTRFLLGPVGRFLVIGVALFICLVLCTFTYYYAKYSRLIDEKLRAGPFANTAKIFAAPESVAVGDAVHSGRDRRRAAPQRLYRIARQPHRLLPASPQFHRGLSRPRILLRPGGRRHQVRRRQDLADRLAPGQHRRAASTSSSRSSSPTFPAPTARSAAW